MVPKKNRADKKTVESIFKEGKFLNSSYFTFKFLKTGNKEIKVSFIVPKSLAKLATKRNSLRRKGYQALKGVLPLLPPGLSGVLVFKKYDDDVAKLENEIKDIFNKLH